MTLRAGSALFDLSQLLAFRRGEHDPSAQLASLSDANARDLVLHMTARDPSDRLPAARYIEEWTTRGMFPAYFGRLHDFCTGLMTAHADQKMEMIAAAFGSLMASIVREESFGGASASGKKAPGVGRADGGGQAGAGRGGGGGGDASNDASHGGPTTEASRGAGESPGGAVPFAADGSTDGLVASAGSLGESLGLDRRGIAPTPPMSPSPFLLDPGGGDAMIHDIGQLLGDPQSPSGDAAGRRAPTPGVQGPRDTSDATEGESPSSTNDVLPRAHGGVEASAFFGALGSPATSPEAQTGDSMRSAVHVASDPMRSAVHVASLAEVAWETVFENQLRESPGAPWKASDRAADRRREDVQLPREGGWRWGGEWETMDGGWAHFDGHAGWTTAAEPAVTATWRRRTWRRKRIRGGEPRAAAAAADVAPMTHLDRPGDVLCGAREDADGRRLTRTDPATAAEEEAALEEAAARGAQCPGAVLVAALICSSVRGVVRPSSRRAALKLLAGAASVADDDTRLQLVVPFCVSLSADPAAAVRAAAVDALSSVLKAVETFPASDSKVFSEYIWPSLSGLARDREESVRVAYAAALATLASTSARFLQRASAPSVAPANLPGLAGGQSGSGEAPGVALTDTAAATLSLAGYETDLAALRAVVRGVVLDYLTPDGAGVAAPPTVGSPDKRTFTNEGGGGARSLSRGLSLSRGNGGLAAGGRSAGPFSVGPRGVTRANEVRRPTNRVTAEDIAGEAAGASANTTRADSPMTHVGRAVGFSRPGSSRWSEPPGGHPSASQPAGVVPTGVSTGVPTAVGPSTRAALLADAEALAHFFGRADSNDFLVPLLITCLNDRAWSLRAAFFRHIAAVGRLVGGAPCEAFLLPCVERCLSDSQDEVVAWALQCLGDMVGAPNEAREDVRPTPAGPRKADEPGETNPRVKSSSSTPFPPFCLTPRCVVLKKRSVVAAAKRAAPALCHPATAVRRSAARFFSAAAAFLGPADTFALLLTLVRPFLADSFASLGAAAADLVADQTLLLAALRRPPTNKAFDAAVDAAAGVVASDARQTPVNGDERVPVHQDEGDDGARAPDEAACASVSVVVPKPVHVPAEEKKERRAAKEKKKEKPAKPPKLNPALSAAAAAAAAGGGFNTHAAAHVQDATPAAGIGAAAEAASAEEEAATLAALEPYIRSLASARRGRGSARAAEARSLVAGGLAPMSDPAVNGGRRSIDRGPPSGAAAGGPTSSIGGRGAGGGWGSRRDELSSAALDASWHPGVSQAIPDRVEEGSLNPLEGMTDLHPETRPGGSPEGGGGRAFGIEDAGGATAWTASFGPRSPFVVPPGAPLVALPPDHPYVTRGGSQGGSPFPPACAVGASPGGSGPAADASGSRTSSGGEAAATWRAREPPGGHAATDVSNRERTRGNRGLAGSSSGPESVTDALSAAMAKGLDLVSGGFGGLAGGAAVGSAGVNHFPGGLPGGYASGQGNDQWAPRGVLVAHLQEHRRPVHALTVSSDGLFFVSGAEDGACKLWDCGRLDRDVSFRSRLTYASQGGRVTALAMLSDDDHAVASASDNGSVHVWRPEYVERKPTAGGEAGSSGPAAPGRSPELSGRRGTGGGWFEGGVRPPPTVERYTGAAEIRQAAPGEGAVTSLDRVAARVVCYASQRGGLHGWDLRQPNEAFRIRLPPQLGTVTCTVTEGTTHAGENGSIGGDPRWMVVGTAAGCLALIDLRFGVVAADWRHPEGASTPIDALALASPATHRGNRPLVWAAAGQDEIALWDVAEGACVRVLRVVQRDKPGGGGPTVSGGEEKGGVRGGVPAALSLGGSLARAPVAAALPDWAALGRMTPSQMNDAGWNGAPRGKNRNLELDFRVGELQEAPPRPEGARCLLPLASGALLAGSGDACVRLWMPGDPSRCRVVAGPLAPGSKPRYEETFVGADTSARPAGRTARGAPRSFGRYQVGVTQELPSWKGAGGSGSGGQADTGCSGERVASAAARHDCHRDAVLRMAVVGTGMQRMLVSAGRDTAVKVWK